MDPFHERLARIAFEAGGDLGLVLAPTMARFEVRADRQACEIDLLKAGVGPPVLLDVGPVLALDDAIGLKVGALHDRGTHRDFIDVHAAHTRGGYPLRELERLGAVHQPGFSHLELLGRLEAVGFLAGARFHDYGLTDGDVDDLRRWAMRWADDLRQRLATEDTDESSHTRGPDWDAYLED